MRRHQRNHKRQRILVYTLKGDEWYQYLGNPTGPDVLYGEPQAVKDAKENRHSEY